MEILIEVLGEIILEVFFEGIAALISSLVNYLDRNKKVRRKLTKVLTIIFYSLCILLVILSIIHKKSFLVLITLGYILIFIIIQLLKYLNKNIFNKNYINILCITLKKIINYAFPILLIVFGSIYLTDIKAKVWLIVLSSLTIFIFMCIDIYRLNRYIKIKKRNKK